ncbi:MAG: carbonic anhydrase [Pirellulaceae bacterium]|nr:carbonic anhydrase [Pirellulaceae bacterium]
MNKLIQGFHRFRRNDYLPNRAFFEALAARQQQPVALFITCSDSRVNPNLITQTEPGDLFIIRNAGNIVPPHSASPGAEEATVEYSIEVLGVRDIIICGHSQCGAMQALVNENAVADLPAARAWFSHAEATRRIVRQRHRHLPPDEMQMVAAEENVLVQMNNLSTHPAVAARLSSGELRVYGWFYDIGQGRLRQYDQAQGNFSDLNGEAHAAAPLPIRMAAAC